MTRARETQEWTAFRPDGAMDLEATLDCGQAFRWRAASSPALGDHFEGVVFGNRVRLKQVESELLFTSEPDPPSSFRPVLQDYLGLGHDLEAIYTALASDSVLAPLIHRYPGLRILSQEPWECLVSFICSANNNIARISQNVEDIARAFGRRIALQDGERWAFPSPQAVADAGESALRDLRLGYKAKYVHQTAALVSQGQVDLYALREESYERALEAVTTLPGVADKVGNCVLLFSLDKLEAFPVDVHIHRAMWDSYPDTRAFIPSPRDGPKPRKPTPKQVRQIREWAAQRFGPHAGYANQYLFYDDLLKSRRR